MANRSFQRARAAARHVALNRAVCESLEKRQLFSGIPNAADNVDDLTVLTSIGSTLSLDPQLAGPLPFAFTNGQPKAEQVQPDGKRLVAGYVNGNWAIARYNLDGSLDATFGGDGKVIIDLGTSSDRALNINVRPDGKILLVGITSGSGDNWQFAVIRLNADGTFDTTFANNGKLLSGLGRAPTYGGVAIILKDGRIHLTGWDGNTSKAMEFDADGKKGFDRLANLNTLATQDFKETPERPHTPMRGTLGWFAARAPILSPDAGLSRERMHAEDIGLQVGDAYEAGIPDGTGRTLSWGDLDTTTVANGSLSATHSYSSAGSENTSAVGAWNTLGGSYSFRPAVGGAGAQGTIRVADLNLAAEDVFDADNHDLVLNDPSVATFSIAQAWVLGGYSAAVDSDKTGIVSSAGQASSGVAILALFDNALAGFSDWPEGSGDTVSATAVIGKYTYIGDVTMDGQVGALDYAAVDANIGTSQDPGISWWYGDTNFDGNIDATDMTGLDAALGLGTAGSGTPQLAGGASDAPMTLETVQVADASAPPPALPYDPEPPRGPDSLYAVAMPGSDPAHDSVRLTWHASGGAASSYRIERSTSSDFSTALTPITFNPASIVIDVPYPEPFALGAVASDPFQVSGDLSFKDFVSDDLGLIIGADEQVTITANDPATNPATASTLTIPDDAILLRNTTYAFGLYGGTVTVRNETGDKSFDVIANGTQIIEFEQGGFETREAFQGVTDEEMRQRGWVGDDGLANLKYVQAGDSPYVTTTISGFFEHYTDTPQADDTYYYRVFATDGVNDVGQPTNVAEASTPATAPDDVLGAYVSQFDDGSYGLNGSDNSNNETGFEIIRTTNPLYGAPAIPSSDGPVDGGYTTTRFAVGANITNFRDTTASPGVQYYYLVQPLAKVPKPTRKIAKAKSLSTAINVVMPNGQALIPSTLTLQDMALVTFASGTAVHVYADTNVTQQFPPQSCRYTWTFEGGDAKYNILPGFNAANVFTNTGMSTVTRHITLTIDKPLGDGSIVPYVSQILIDVQPQSSLTTYSVSTSAQLIEKLSSSNSNLRIRLARGPTFSIDNRLNLKGKKNIIIEADAGTAALPVLSLTMNGRTDDSVTSLFDVDGNTHNITILGLRLTSDATVFSQQTAPKIMRLGSGATNLSIVRCELDRLNGGFEDPQSGSGLLVQESTTVGTWTDGALSHQHKANLLPGYFVYTEGALLAPGEATPSNIVLLGNYAKGSGGQGDVRLEHGTRNVLVFDNRLLMPSDPPRGVNAQDFKLGPTLRMEGSHIWASKNKLWGNSILIGSLSGPDSAPGDKDYTTNPPTPIISSQPEQELQHSDTLIFDSNVVYSFDYVVLDDDRKPFPGISTAPSGLVEIGPNSKGTVIRNNIFWGNSRIVIKQQKPRSEQFIARDVWIVNNTRLNPTHGAFLSFEQTHHNDEYWWAETDERIRLKNLHLANNLTAAAPGDDGGTWDSSGVALASLKGTGPLWADEIQHNLPDSPEEQPGKKTQWWDANNIWLLSATFKIDTESPKSQPTRFLDGWNSLFGNTSAAGTADAMTKYSKVSGYWRARSGIANLGNRAIAGGGDQVAAWDYYGNLRPFTKALGFRAGAVQSDPANILDVPPKLFPS